MKYFFFIFCYCSDCQFVEFWKIYHTLCYVHLPSFVLSLQLSRIFPFVRHQPSTILANKYKKKKIYCCITLVDLGRVLVEDSLVPLGWTVLCQVARKMKNGQNYIHQHHNFCIVRCKNCCFYQHSAPHISA